MRQDEVKNVINSAIRAQARERELHGTNSTDLATIIYEFLKDHGMLKEENNIRT